MMLCCNRFRLWLFALADELGRVRAACRILRYPLGPLPLAQTCAARGGRMPGSRANGDRHSRRVQTVQTLGSPVPAILTSPGLADVVQARPGHRSDAAVEPRMLPLRGAERQPDVGSRSSLPSS